MRRATRSMAPCLHKTHAMATALPTPDFSQFLRYQPLTELLQA